MLVKELQRLLYQFPQDKEITIAEMYSEHDIIDLIPVEDVSMMTCTDQIVLFPQYRPPVQRKELLKC